MARDSAKAKKESLLMRILHLQARVVITLMVPMAMLMTLFVMVHLTVNSTFARNQVEGLLEGIFAGQVNIGEIRLGVDPRFVSIYGVSLVLEDGREMAQIHQLEGRVALLALLRNQLIISRIEVVGGTALAGFDEHGHLTFEEFFRPEVGVEDPPEEEEGGLEIRVDQLIVREVDAVVRFPDFEVLLNDVNLINFSLSIVDGGLKMAAESLLVPHGSLSFKPEMFGFSSTGRPANACRDSSEAKPMLEASVEDLLVQGWDWSDSAFTVESIRMDSEGANFELTDGMLDVSDPAGALKYRATMDMKLPPSSLFIEYFTGPLVSSPVEVKMSAEGVLGAELSDNSHIGVDVESELAQLELMGLSFERARLKARLVNRRFYFLAFDGAGYDGEFGLVEESIRPLPPWAAPDIEPPQVSEQAYVNLLDLSYYLPVWVRDVRLADVLMAVTASSQAPLDAETLIPVTGRLSAELSARGRLVGARDTLRWSDLCEPQDALPDYHQVSINSLILRRDDEAVSRPEAIVPTRRLSMTGGLLYTPDRVEVTRELVVRLDNDLVEVPSLSLDLSDPAMPVEGRLTASLGDLTPYTDKLGLSGFGGAVSLSVDASGPLMNPTLSDGLLVVDEPVVAGLPGEQATLRFGLNDGTLSMASLETMGRFGDLKASGTVGLYRGELTNLLPDPVLDIDFSADPLDLGAGLSVLSEAGMADLGVAVSGLMFVDEGRVSGSVSDLRVAARLRSGGPLRVDTQVIDAIEAEVDLLLSGGDLSVRGLTMRLDPSRSRISGDIDFNFDGRLDLNLLVDGLNFSDVAALRASGVTGQLAHLDLTLRGPLDLAALGREGQALDVAEVLTWFTTQPLEIMGGVSVRRLAVAGQQLGDAFGAWLTLDEALRLTLSFMPYIPPEAGFPIVDPDRASFFDPTLRLYRGDLTPLIMASLASLIPAPPQAALALGAAFVERQGKRRIFRPASLVALERRARRQRGVARSVNEGLRSVHPAELELQAVIPQDISGGDEAFVLASFSRLDLRAVLAGVVEQQAVLELQADSLAALVEAHARSVAATYKKAQRVQAGMSDEQKQAMVINPVPFVPRRVRSSTQQALQPLESLNMSGEVEVLLDRRTKDLDVYAVLPELRVHALGQRLSNSEDVVISYKDKRVEVESLTIGDVTLSGEAVLLPQDIRVDMRLAGDLSMGLFNLMPDVYTDLKGRVGVDLRLAGQVSDPPEISGTVRFYDELRRRVSLRVRSLGEELVIRSGVVALCPTRVAEPSSELGRICGGGSGGPRIVLPQREPLRLELLEGKTSLSGDMLMTGVGIKDIKLNFNARNLSYRSLAGGTEVSLTLHTAGQLRVRDLSDARTWSVGGELDIIDGRVTTVAALFEGQRALLRSAVGGGQTARFQASIFEQLPFLQFIRLDGVNLRIRDGFRINGDFDSLRLGLDLSANINIDGAVGTPSLGGIMSLLPGGAVTWQGSDFVVREGSVVWSGDPYNPEVAMTADVDIENKCIQASSDDGDGAVAAEITEIYRITLKVEGQVADGELEPNFTSQPFVNQADIATLILTGCTADQLNASAASSPGLALALDQVLSNVEDNLENFLRVEDLQIVSDLNTTEVVITEQLTPRFRLRFSGVFGNGGAQQSFAAQYTLLDNLLFEGGERSTNNGVQLDARLKFTYPFD